jgi:hypothetical protein
VFAQRPGATAEIDAWNAHATRFFAARVGLAESPRGDSNALELKLVVAPERGSPGVVAVLGRRRQAGDLAAADAAEAHAGGGGLALLARRCETVWWVQSPDETDATALLLAAILASTMLGPILEARTLDLFGVKTARAKLAALSAP